MIDSLIPTGGFAHSLGLEAAVQEGIVREPRAPEHGHDPDPDDSHSLRTFAISTLWQSANFALPIVYSSHRAVGRMEESKGATWNEEGDEDEDAAIARIETINQQATALYTNHVASKASLAQGNTLLRVARTTYLDGRDGDPIRMLVRLRQRIKHLHHAVVFGVVCALLHVDATTCQQMYLFVVLRDVMSAATRLNLVGPMQAARLQYECAPLLDKVLASKKDREIDDSYSSAPVLDLVQAMHDQLYTRIFNS